MKLKRFFIAACFVLVLPLASHAQSIIQALGPCATTGPQSPGDACSSLDTFLNVFAVVAQWLLGITGSVVLLMFVWGGAQWIFSAGSSKMIESGKKKMTGAVIGMVLVFGALAIVRSIRIGLGVTTVQCVIDSDCPKSTACQESSVNCDICYAGQCKKPADVAAATGGTVPTEECIVQNDCLKKGPGYDCSAAHKCFKIVTPSGPCVPSECAKQGSQYFCKHVGGVLQCFKAESCADYTSEGQTVCESGKSGIQVPNGSCQWLSQVTNPYCIEVSPAAGQIGEPCPPTGCGAGKQCVYSIPSSGLAKTDVCTDGRAGSPCDANASSDSNGCLSIYECDDSASSPTYYKCKSTGAQQTGQTCFANADCASGTCTQARCE